MPVWSLVDAKDGSHLKVDVVDFKADKHGTVLSFAIRFEYHGKPETETFMLALRHHQREVPRVVKGVLELVSGSGGASVGYKVGSAGGMVGGLTGAALGLFLGHLATHVAEGFFSEQGIEEGDYYDSRGDISFRGPIRLR
jgi:hypothetical protein